MSPQPILYSFRRCPYAMRARMTLSYAGIEVRLREVILRDKPAAMLAASSKGTVPVLIQSDGKVIDESRDIMRWALNQNDPASWLESADRDDSLVDLCDSEFKHWLDRYKYAVRFPERDEGWYRQQGEQFLAQLEMRLSQWHYLSGASLSVVDVAIAPFVRQFASVDSPWWSERPYPSVSDWLHEFINSALFLSVMNKYPQWLEGDADIPFPTQPYERL
jgi:glutathione S-transferase